MRKAFHFIYLHYPDKYLYLLPLYEAKLPKIQGVQEKGRAHLLVRQTGFFLSPWKLALTMPTINNYQLNEALGETFKLWVLH